MRRTKDARGRRVGIIAVLLAAMLLTLVGTSPAGAKAKKTTKKTTTKKAATTTTAKKPPKASGPVKGTIKIGQLATSRNTTTGAATNEEQRKLLAEWAKAVNARGGVNGYKVEVLYRADDADNAKATAAIKDLAKEGVVALVGDGSFTYEAVNDGSKKYGLPVIGGAASTPHFYDEPLWFGTSAALPVVGRGYAYAAKDFGAKSMRALYCIELVACSSLVAYTKIGAQEIGLKYSEQQVPQNAVDYTPQCLQAKQDDIDVLWLTAVNITSMVRDCKRQSYHPIYGVVGATNDIISQLGGERAIGFIFAFPPLYRGPEVTEFLSIARKMPGIKEEEWTEGSSRTYTAAKMFEKAMERMTAVNPTSADVVAALKTVKNETLGGVTGPINYTTPIGKPNPPNACGFEFTLDNGEWVIATAKGQKADGLTPRCLPV